MDENFVPVTTIGHSNDDVIKDIMTLYNIEQFDLDCTYSKGVFWRKLPEPKHKTDLYPQSEDVIKANSEKLPFENNSMKSIMYDPPFVIAGKTYKDNDEGSSIIAKRFEGYETFELLKANYYRTLAELYRVCSNKGLVVMKCQDTVSGGKNHFTHVMIMNMVLQIGFYPRDLFILVAKHRINSFNGTKWSKQEHARKHHSYFFVFEKVKPRVNYDFSYLYNHDFIDLDPLNGEDETTYQLAH